MTTSEHTSRCYAHSRVLGSPQRKTLSSQRVNFSSPLLPSPHPLIISPFIFLTPGPQSCGTKSRDLFFPQYTPCSLGTDPLVLAALSGHLLTIHPSSDPCDTESQDAPWHTPMKPPASVSNCDSCYLHSQISALTLAGTAPSSVWSFSFLTCLTSHFPASGPLFLWLNTCLFLFHAYGFIFFLPLGEPANTPVLG